MQTQDEQPGEETRTGSWSVSEVTRPDAEPATRTGRKASTSKRKTSSSRKTPKKGDGAVPTTTTKRKTSKTSKDDEKPKTTAKRKASKTAKDGEEKPKTTAKRKTSKTANDGDEKPKAAAKRKTTKPKSEGKTATSKPKAMKKETGKTTTKRRSSRKQDLGDLISELLERRASGEKGTDSIVAAILVHLTKNMGLSSDAAAMVVAYILKKLVKSKQERAAATRSGDAAAPRGEVPDLGGFFQLARSGQAIDVAPIATDEEVQELAQDAGLDPTTTEASLNQVLKMLGEAAA